MNEDDQTDKEIYKKGFKDGLKCFAWWKDGIEYVGITGTTLKEAQEKCESLYNYDHRATTSPFC